MQIYDLTSLREKKISSPPIQIYAHQGEIACISLNNNATRLATASDKGFLNVCMRLTPNQNVKKGH